MRTFGSSIELRAEKSTQEEILTVNFLELQGTTEAGFHQNKYS